MKRIAFVPVALALLAGCYSYAPVGTAVPARGADIRLVLAPPRDVRLTDYAVNAASRVDGELIALREDEVAVSVFEVVSASGAEYLASGETLVVPRTGVATLEARRTSRFRTALFAGAVGATIFFVDRLVGGGRGGGERSGPRGDQPR